MEKSINMIKKYNKKIESLKIINIFWLRWFKLPNPGQLYGYLISELNFPNPANAAIDKSFIIDSSQKMFQVYNRAWSFNNASISKTMVTVHYNILKAQLVASVPRRSALKNALVTL